MFIDSIGTTLGNNLYRNWPSLPQAMPLLAMIDGVTRPGASYYSVSDSR